MTECSSYHSTRPPLFETAEKRRNNLVVMGEQDPDKKACAAYFLACEEGVRMFVLLAILFIIPLP